MSPHLPGMPEAEMAFQRPLGGFEIFGFKDLQNGRAELCGLAYALAMAIQENLEAARSQRRRTVA